MAATALARALMATDLAEAGAVVGTAASTCITSTEAEAGAACERAAATEAARMGDTEGKGGPAGFKGGGGG